MNKHTSITQLASAFALIAALTLSGCTLSMTDGPEAGANEAAGQNSHAPTESTDEDTQTAPDPVETDNDSAHDTYSRGGHPPLTREELLDQVRTQLTCPDGYLEIDGIATSVEIVDDCEEVVVTGDVPKIVAQHIGTLTVSGTGADIIVISVDHIEVTEDGDIALVAWETGSPSVIDRSIGSTILPLSELNR